MKSQTSEFAASLPVVDEFSQALSQHEYISVPSDWLIAVTDVVKSRDAIRAGKFKPVNMAGVAMISGIMNAIGHQQVPYIFGGDGAAVTFAPEDEEAVRDALSRTVGWVEDELGLQLRAAIIPVAEVEKVGSTLLANAVQVSPHITNFAFIGGGISTAEKLMKEGKFGISRMAGENYPDLSGLSCRWTPVEAQGKTIVSLIVEPWKEGEAISPDVLHEIMNIVGGGGNAHPVPQSGPGFKWPPEGLELEARATRGAKPLVRMKILLYLITFLARILDMTGWKLGEFDPVRYREKTALNTDYRKIQDGIRMTVSLEAGEVNALQDYLEAEYLQNRLHYGIQEQDSAVLTCFVPSIMSDSHFHFLDGAGGGYAAAADNLK